MCRKIVILFFLTIRMSASWGQCFVFNGKIVNAASGQPVAASFSIRTDSRKQTVGKSNEQGAFALQIPCNPVSLIIEKPGFRTITMPVTGKEGSYYFELGLFPVDKQVNDRPYFQSEQQDLVLDNSDASKNKQNATRLFRLVDIASKKPVKGEVCLYYTKTGTKTCFPSDPDLHSRKEKIVFTQEDIVGLVVTAEGFQPYNGNLIIDRLDNSSLVYEIALSRQVSVLALSIEPANGKSNPRTELVTAAGNKLNLKMTDAYHGYAAINSGETYQIRVTPGGNASKPVMLSLPPANGLVLVKVSLPDNPASPRPEIAQVQVSNPITLDLSGPRIIYFDQSSYELRPSSRQTLDSLASWLLQNPEYRIEIIGHTDNIGDRNRNMTLSEYRSKVTTNYLVSRGADKKRVHWEAKGGQQPVSSNDEEKTKALNRRVELHILK